MASLSLQKGNRPGYRLMFYSLEKRKCSIWLGPIPEADALEWKKHVEHLLHDVLKHGDLPSKATSHWLRSLPDSESMRSFLSKDWLNLERSLRARNLRSGIGAKLILLSVAT